MTITPMKLRVVLTGVLAMLLLGACDRHEKDDEKKEPATQKAGKKNTTR